MTVIRGGGAKGYMTICFSVYILALPLVSKQSDICSLPFVTKQTYNSFKNLAWSQIKEGLGVYTNVFL
jgi:hypothetical protein